MGKSTLFNRLTKSRQAIVSDEAGTTRDRQYGKCDWNGREFSVVDTGGWVVNSDDIFEEEIRKQVIIATEEADLVLFVCDIKNGVTDWDMDVAQMLQKSGKPVIVCVNKCDGLGEPAPEFYEFYNLGLGDPVQVSAVHGHGTGDLLDRAFECFDFDSEMEEDETIINVAVIGKPNAGKSSLVNKITNEERCIVSDIAGTTRDAIDSEFENEFGKYVFIDTAGIRRKNKVTENLEKYSVMRTLLAVERADVCILMIDANEGVTDQDAKIAGEAHEAGKGIIIAVNKWDEYEKDTNTTEKYKKEIYNKLSYLSYAPIIFISAKTGQRVNKLYELINTVADQNAMRVPTSVLNQVLNEAIAIVQPPSDKGKRLKVFYMTQASTKPPTFVVFVNDKQLFHFSYERYLVNQLRKEFVLTGTPIRIMVREKREDKI